jgi:aspartyl-tRNA(Asn)/glutamyl-tRNA(Gln) amidotransferase subunit A
MSADITRLSIGNLATAYAVRELLPVEVVESYLDRIDQLDGRLSTYTTLTRDTAMGRAAELQREWRRLHALPLYGVPISVKDLFWTAGVRTTAGSRVLADWVPNRDATTVARLRAAGAIVLGKVATHEFAFGGTTQTWENSTMNPWDAARVPGGSSGGSAAALAADLCAASTTTDTGGSSRIPASCCGVVGLKPTYGRVSRAGVVPLSWNLDHIGVMTRSAEDLGRVFDVVAGPDSLDPTTARQGTETNALRWGPSPLARRIGVPRAFIAQLCSQEIREAFEAALEVFRDAGAEIVDIDLFDFGLAEGAQWAIISAEAAAYHRPMIQRRGNDYGDDVRRLLLAGLRLTSADYIRAQQVRRLVALDLATTLADIDLVAMPVMSTVAPTLAEAQESLLSVDDRRLPGFTVFTGLCLYANLSGLPSIALPTFETRSGLPMAFQLMGPAWSERSLIDVGVAFQHETAWSDRRPVVEVSA